MKNQTKALLIVTIVSAFVASIVTILMHKPSVYRKYINIPYYNDGYYNSKK